MQTRSKIYREKNAVFQRLALISLVFSFWGLLTSNPILTFVGIWTLPFLFYLLWQPGQSPAFLLILFYQWLQVFTPVIDANSRSVIIGTDINLPEQLIATYLGYITLIILAIGIRYGVGGVTVNIGDKVKNSISSFDKRSLLRFYLLTFFFSLFITSVMWISPPLTQFLNALRIYKWAVIFIIFWLAVIRPDIRGLALTIFIIETIIGFFGFFGAFKTVFLILIIALAAHNKRRVFGINLKFVVVLVPLVILALVWQTIKVDYRVFQSQGKATQVSEVSIEEKAQYLMVVLSELRPVVVISSFDSLVSRLGYTEFFGHAIATVPDQISFQHGRLWGEALVHVTTPRIFFPDKPNLDDSERTREFTGIQVANAEQGASIGLGYAAESYIDFGPYLMFVPVFILGFAFGYGYRLFLGSNFPSFVGFSVANSFVITSGFLFESSGIKVFGGMLSMLMVNLVLFKLISIIYSRRSKKRASINHI